jgi:hypothetical protein
MQAQRVLGQSTKNLADIPLGMILFLVSAFLALSGCGGGSSAQLPSLHISSISPSSVPAGSGDLQISLVGNFALVDHLSPVVTWSVGGQDTFLVPGQISSSQLGATIPASLLKKPVNALIFVALTDMDGNVTKASNRVSFSVDSSPNQAAPQIDSISPASVTAGGPAFQLSINGAHLMDKDHIEGPFVVFFDGTAVGNILKTTVVNDSLLTATVPAKSIAQPRTVQIIVGSITLDFESNALTLQVLGPAGDAQVSPSADTLGPHGARQFSFTVNGNNTNATWTVEESAAGGTISSSGLYDAPNKSGTYHVTATSVADSSKIATATVSVVASGFTLTGSMTKARSGHTATLLANGKVLIVDGGDGTGELFDPAAGTFAPTGSMTTTRTGFTATLLANGKVLITGGFGPGTGMLPRLTSAELYDPATGSFSATGSMAVGRVKHTSTLLSDGRVLIAGGTDRSGGGGAATASAELYDPSTGTFTLTGSMLTDRAEHSATLLASGKVLIVGGWNGHAADSADDPPWDPLFADLFDASSGSFSSTGSMSTTRIDHKALLLPNQKVIVFGGVPSIQNLHEQPADPQYAELYDPATGKFSSAGGFTLPTSGHSATLLTDGTILIAGGEQDSVAVTRALLFDPVAGASTLTGSLITARVSHTATLLNDGRVLVTGGTDVNGNALASAEIYK